MSTGVTGKARNWAGSWQDKILEKAVNFNTVREACRFGSTELPELTEELESIDFPDVTGRYVAGETADEAYGYVEELNDSGVVALVNMLGEHIEDPEEVEEVKQEYVDLLREFDERDLDAELSVKLTQLGWDLEEEDEYQTAKNNVSDLAEQAESNGDLFWIDMEHRGIKDETIDFYEKLNSQHGNVGLCLQAYLDDTLERENGLGDLERVQKMDGTIRLVKGAYDSESDYENWDDISDEYEKLMETLFEGDAYFAIATHDEDLVERALEMQQEYGRDQEEFEFQFLKGVADDIQADLAENYTVKEYVPYGDNRFDYFWRRVLEHPQNLRHGIETIRQEAEINPGKVPGDIARMV